MLSSLAAAALLVPSIATAQEQASKHHYTGIYKGTIPVGLPTNGDHNQRAKAQLVCFPDGRLLVLSVESPQARNPMNIKGTLKKNVFTGKWKKGFLGAISFFTVAPLWLPLPAKTANRSNGMFPSRVAPQRKRNRKGPFSEKPQAAERWEVLD